MTTDEPPPGRESTLTFFLTAIVVMFALGLLMLIAGGWLIVLAMVLGGMAFLGCMHYFLWGKLLSDEVAGEREEEILRERAAAPEWPEEEKDYRIRKPF